MKTETEILTEQIEQSNQEVLANTNLQELYQFCKENRVEILLQEDCEYHCFVNYHEGKGSLHSDFNPLIALVFTMNKFKNKKASNSHY